MNRNTLIFIGSGLVAYGLYFMLRSKAASGGGAVDGPYSNTGSPSNPFGDGLPGVDGSWM